MVSGAQQRAVGSFRRRQAEAGMMWFEVAALRRDKELIRRVAKRLAEAGPAAEEARAKLQRALDEAQPRRGGIWLALRGSPLVGADLNFGRDQSSGCDGTL